MIAETIIDSADVSWSSRGSAARETFTRVATGCRNPLIVWLRGTAKWGGDGAYNGSGAR